MKRLSLLLNILIGTLILVIIGLLVFKFFIPPKKSKTKIEISLNHFEKITVLDMIKHEIKLKDMTSEDESTYCLLYEISNCYSCIYKGIEDMKTLKKTGKKCMIFVIHHSLEEVAGQASLYEFSPFFMMRKEVYYDYFNIPILPSVVQIKNGKIISGRFITP